MGLSTELRLVMFLKEFQFSMSPCDDLPRGLKSRSRETTIFSKTVEEIVREGVVESSIVGS
jgi:hypothetical protein